MSKALLCAGVVWFSLTGLAADPGKEKEAPDTPWGAAFAAAQMNAKTEAGEKYARKIAKQVEATVSEGDEACALVVTRRQEMSFAMLLRIRGTGEVEELLVKPETAYALCQRVIVVPEKFAKPPSAPYWVKVDIGTRKGNP